MIGRIIEWSARNVMLVLIGAALLTLAGLYAIKTTPLDAIPDLSDTQVIVYTEYAGQATTSGGRSSYLPSHNISAECAAL